MAMINCPVCDFRMCDGVVGCIKCGADIPPTNEKSPGHKEKTKQFKEEDTPKRNTETKTPLEEANTTIRRANHRINELKAKIKALEHMCAKKDDDIKHLKDLIARNNSELTSEQWLGLTDTYNKQEVRKNYKKLVLIYHPDKGTCGAAMTKINKAYENVLQRTT
ncbi:J domain-containing protein [Vibrio mediterranei]|uniref:J domain-containing protein n=1 Tax=Vibrio mediterranei TaxID=689 RepID=UPI004067A326